jgi:hypothetical protein
LAHYAHAHGVAVQHRTHFIGGQKNTLPVIGADKAMAIAVASDLADEFLRKVGRWGWFFF